MPYLVTRSKWVVRPKATSILKSGWVLPHAHTLGGVRDWKCISEVDGAELSYLLGLPGKDGEGRKGSSGLEL